jgi:NADH-quinone oxidoreductase subunit E
MALRGIPVMTVERTRPDTAAPTAGGQEGLDRMLETITGNDQVISVLEEIQERCGYLPEKALGIVADRTGRSLVDVYGVATFYSSFSLKPRGKHSICACLGTACHVRGAKASLKELTKRLGIEPGETTSDGEITLETANCLGACALGPILTVDGRYLSNVRPSTVNAIVERTKSGAAACGNEHDIYAFPMNVSCIRCGAGLLDHAYPIDGHPSIILQLAADNGETFVRHFPLYAHSLPGKDDAGLDGGSHNACCPQCKGQLTDTDARCIECDSPMITLLVNEGEARLRLCPRRGCTGRTLDLGFGSEY